MTIDQYNQVRDDLENRYREGMAALEQLWKALTGSNPPGSPVEFQKVSVNFEEPHGLRSAESLGIPSANKIEGMLGRSETSSKKYPMTPEQLAKKKAYMKAYWAKRKQQKSAA